MRANISTGNISRNISFCLPYLCAVFLKCLFTLRCTKARKGTVRPPTFIALALLLIRNVDFTEKLDSSLKEFKFFFYASSFLFIVFPLARTKILNSSNIYTRKAEIAAVSKKR